MHRLWLSYPALAGHNSARRLDLSLARSPVHPFTYRFARTAMSTARCASESLSALRATRRTAVFSSCSPGVPMMSDGFTPSASASAAMIQCYGKKTQLGDDPSALPFHKLLQYPSTKKPPEQGACCIQIEKKADSQSFSRHLGAFF